MDRKQLAGYGFVMAQAAQFANGLVALKSPSSQQRHAGMNRMASSMVWAGSSMILARYGTYPLPRQIETLKGKLASFMESEGIPLDAASWQEDANRHRSRGWMHKLEDYLYAYPVELSNLYSSLGAGFLLASGVLRRTGEQAGAGSGNIAQSLLVMAGTLASIFISEKTRQQVERQGDSGTLWGHMQEHPLSYSNGLFLISDLIQGKTALEEYKYAAGLKPDNAFRPWVFTMSAISAFAMACSVTGDILTAGGSKKPGGSPEELAEAHQQLFSEAATILSAQPPEVQQAMIRKAAQYLATQPELRMTDEDALTIQQAMREALEMQRDPSAPMRPAGQHARRLMLTLPQPVTQGR